MNSLEYDIYNLPSAIMMEHQMSPDTIQTLNTYLDKELQNPDRQSLSNELVGQIHQGQQLSMDFECDQLKDFRAMVENLGVAYLRHFVEQTGTMIRPKQVVTAKLWSVHSYEGDYNPIHDHGTKTIMGISCTTWTKVPPQIVQGPRPGSQEYGLYNASGESDGCLCFNYGQSSTWDRERLKPTQNVVVRPQVGRLYMFPSWMQHMVYPFQGEGERRTVAANINCFPVEGSQDGNKH